MAIEDMDAGAGVAFISGPAGPPGTDGKTWRSGATVPDNSLGADGDLYLRSNGDISVRVSGSYVVILNIAPVLSVPLLTPVLAGLPTTLPGTAGQLWNDGGHVSIS